jgi:hypothetical protein
MHEHGLKLFGMGAQLAPVFQPQRGGGQAVSEVEHLHVDVAVEQDDLCRLGRQRDAGPGITAAQDVIAAATGQQRAVAEQGDDLAPRWQDG